jgi:NADH-quinone oxidoreductase subunit M
VQRVYLGAEYKGPHAEAITPITDREAMIGGVLLALCIVMGVYPGYLFDKMQHSVTLLVNAMNATKGLAEAARQMSGM